MATAAPGPGSTPPTQTPTPTTTLTADIRATVARLRAAAKTHGLSSGTYDEVADARRRTRQALAVRASAAAAATTNQRLGAEIPRFYVRKPTAEAAPPEPATPTASNTTRANELLTELAQQRRAARLRRSFPFPEDLERLQQLLQTAADERGLIDYDALKAKVGKVLHDEGRGERTDAFFTAATFLKFRRTDMGQIEAHAFFVHVYATTFLARRRADLLEMGLGWDGFLTEEQITSHVRQLLTSNPACPRAPEDRALYEHMIVRKLVFALDPGRSPVVRIPVSVFLASDEYRDLCVYLDTVEAAAAASAPGSAFTPEQIAANEEMLRHVAMRSWYSVENFHRVFNMFIALDQDQNGLLNQAEFQQFNGGKSLTPAFVQRVFEDPVLVRESAKFKGELDFKNFLRFLLAYENRSSRAALAYFWPLLDVRELGHIDAFTINYFYRDVAACLAASEEAFAWDEHYEVPRVADVKDEIFDIVNPRDPLRITFEDLLRCGKGDTVVTMLVDPLGFLAYDNRENQMAEDAREEQMQFQLARMQQQAQQAHASHTHQAHDVEASATSAASTPTPTDMASAAHVLFAPPGSGSGSGSPTGSSPSAVSASSPTTSSSFIPGPQAFGALSLDESEFGVSRGAGAHGSQSQARSGPSGVGHSAPASSGAVVLSDFVLE